MMKCISGHQTNSFTKCEICGQPADLNLSLNALNEVPEFQTPWNDTTILTVDLPNPNFANAWHLELKPAQSPEATEQAFTFKNVSGET